MEFSAQQIAGFLNGTIEGDPNVKVSNFLNMRIIFIIPRQALFW